MKSFLIKKTLSLDYLLIRMIGKKRGIVSARTIEKAILIFGRREVPRYNKKEMPTEQ